MTRYPTLCQTVLDAVDVRALAEFYRALLGLRYRAGDEAPADGAADVADWLVLLRSDGSRALAVQRVDTLHRTTWPSPDVPMQMHLDMTVQDVEELRDQRVRCEALGGVLLRDGSADPDEPIYVLADPEGHPFCLFVAPALAGRADD